MDQKTDEFQVLSDVGALPPPSEESDDGRVEREVDVLSEAPDIDTTRAEERPSKMRRLGWICCLLPIIALVVVILVATIDFITSHSKCSVADVLNAMSALNASDLESGVLTVYEECKI